MFSEDKICNKGNKEVKKEKKRLREFNGAVVPGGDG